MKTYDRRHPLVALGVLGLVLALGFSACMKVPYTGRQQAVLLSFDQEVQLGSDAYIEILREETVVTSGPLATQVSSIARAVSKKTPRPFRDLPWEFKLLASDSVNAFALPGGKVAVYTGIVPVLANEAGLASVLGHEVGHVVARHSAERMTGTLLLQLGLAAADIGLSNTEIHDQLMAMLGLGAAVGVVLPFSRANELESDYLGGIFMARAGLDPKESWAVWERMTELSGGDNPLPIFSTHPSNSKRIQRLKEELPTFEKHYKASRSQRGRGQALAMTPPQALTPPPGSEDPPPKGDTPPKGSKGEAGKGEPAEEATESEDPPGKPPKGQKGK